MRFKFQRTVPQRIRRVLVFVYFALFLNGLAVFFLGIGAEDKAVVNGSLLGVIAAGILGGILYLVSSPADFRPARLLDERQNSIRLEAMGAAYRILCILLVLLHLAVALQGVYGYELKGVASLPGGSAMFMFPIVLLSPSLPQALVAWREPDAPCDDSGTT